MKARKPSTFAAALLALSISTSTFAQDKTGEFLDARKPLAKSQAVLIRKQVFSYLLARPWHALKCAGLFLTGNNYAALAKDPENFEILKLMRHQSGMPTAENSFNFTNGDAGFDPICDVEYGVCQGMTNLDRRINVLGHFDPENRSKIKVPTAPKKRFEFYEKLVRRMAASEPTIIPGFANLQQFSADPVGARVLREMSLKIWAKENTTLPVIAKVLASVRNHLTRQEVRDLHAELSERLARHYNPIVYLSKPIEVTHSKWIHVMQVYKIDPKDTAGSYKIYLKDPNYNSPNNLKEALVTGEGRATFENSELSDIGLMPGDDSEIAEFIYSSMDFCKKNPSFCVEN